MKLIKLDLKERSYNIIIGNNIISLLPKYISKLKIGTDAYLITNAFIKNKYGNILSKILKQSGFSVRFKVIPDTEKSKSLYMVSSLIKDITDYDKKKRIFLIAFGGGVVGDLTGFAASIYKRGIPYVQVPTTLLAQVDSSIGGKTAVDIMQGKNLIGAFYQPRLVFSDVGFLKTLDLRQIRSGLAEVIKYALIKDPQLFVYLEKKYKDMLVLKQTALEYVVRRCSYIKAKIVQKDEKDEKGIRVILNFGHTLGHAIETASAYKKYNHGEAVALGMLMASDLSDKLGLISKEVYKRIENLINELGLPVMIEKVSIEDIIRAYYHDKKFIGAKNKFILIQDIGKTKLVENIPIGIIREVLKKRFDARGS